MAGRGFGKTRTGAEYIRDEVENHGARRIALVGRITSDVRDVMVEGESGILEISPPQFRPIYEPSKRKLTWPNGAIAKTFSAEKPDELRGPQHDLAWADELATWKYAQEAWDNLMLGLRIGRKPRIVTTTTPRPINLIRGLLERDGEDVVVVRGTTYENLHNLAPTFKDQIIRQYEGTRLGQQELEAILLDEVPGALWTRADIETPRVQKYPDLARVVVGVDPAATSGDEANQTGIVVAGKVGDEGYVIEDKTLRASPEGWATAAINAYLDHEADLIIAEDNNGGEMVESTIKTAAKNMKVSVNVKRIRASRGKHTRAEPIAAMYEQGRIHHVGSFPELEDQMCTWVPGEDSPDRMDAMVWAVTDLLLIGTPVMVLS
jgi:phage terminase large subunit-like protein